MRLEEANVKAYLKAIGNPAGSHVLACEWVGSQLARWFGLSTFDFGLIRIEEEDEIPLGDGFLAESGAAFVSAKEPGFPWPGTQKFLDLLLNPEDVARMVVFDTWVLNADRFRPQGMQRKPNRENVFLSTRDDILDRYRLLAIDHTHCFANGAELSVKVRSLQYVRDGRLYGLFPEFEPYFLARYAKQAIEKFREISTTMIDRVLASVPPEWGVRENALSALGDLLLERARWLADGADEIILPHCRMHDGELTLDGGNENGGK